jgi:pyridoxal phosphate enzyme (YggS family)
VRDILERNLASLRRRIEEACRKAGRASDSVVLLPVTKYVAPSVARTLAELGLCDLAESRVQELEHKASALASERDGPPIRWHLVGHLQRNKARRAVRWADLIHSVDSWALLETLDRLAAEERPGESVAAEGRRIGAFLEVRWADLPGRTGFSEGELLPVVSRVEELERVDLCGLMAIAPPPESDPELRAARDCFRTLARLREDLPESAFRQGRCRLSMGMSNDFEIAIAEGADIVRIGSLLFRGLEPSLPGVNQAGPAENGP